MFLALFLCLSIDMAAQYYGPSLRVKSIKNTASVSTLGKIFCKRGRKTSAKHNN